MEHVIQTLTAHVSKYINAKYFSVKSSVTYDDPHYDCRNTLYNKDVDVYIQAYIFAELMNSIPDTTLCNITHMVETLQCLDTTCSKTVVGWGHESRKTQYSYTVTDSSIGAGTLTLYLIVRWEGGCNGDSFTHEIAVTIENVIYKDHAYYYLTNTLEEWLRVEGKPKRKAALEQLFI